MIHFSGYNGYSISIHALREEGDLLFHKHRHKVIISIHALREEGDFVPAAPFVLPTNFYPRPPRGGRRQGIRRSCVNFIISIHALREEGDRSRCTSCSWQPNFYPRPPRGGRPDEHLGEGGAKQFLSTPSARRATGGAPDTAHCQPDFYPRPPRGGRHGSGQQFITLVSFLSTPSARRATYEDAGKIVAVLFLSTPSARRATHTGGLRIHGAHISIHALREEGDGLRRTF